MNKNVKRISSKDKLRNAALTALFASIICICSWITVPFTVPFTMQTFGIFCTLLILGGKSGTAAVCLYVALGAVGLPVFSGFGAGLGHLFGMTGGYIIGFIFTALVYWLVTKFFGEKTFVKIIGLTAGLAVCYIFGTVWFAVLYTEGDFLKGISYAFTVCVLPFLIPDGVKLAAAWAVSAKIKGRM